MDYENAIAFLNTIEYISSGLVGMPCTQKNPAISMDQKVVTELFEYLNKNFWRINTESTVLDKNSQLNYTFEGYTAVGQVVVTPRISSGSKLTVLDCTFTKDQGNFRDAANDYCNEDSTSFSFKTFDFHDFIVERLGQDYPEYAEQIKHSFDTGYFDAVGKNRDYFNKKQGFLLYSKDIQEYLSLPWQHHRQKHLATRIVNSLNYFC